MTEGDSADRMKVEEILSRLDKSHGKVHPLPEEKPLDHAVFLILRERWDYRKAHKALQILQSEFVDWNEVRVSSAGEIRDLLRPLGDSEVDVKVEKIFTLLQFVWRERNCVNLDFLGEMDPERQMRVLQGAGVLTAGQIQIVLQAMAGTDEFLVSPHATRVLQRIGVITRVYSDSGARKSMEALMGPEDLFRFQSHLVQHGDEICLARSPRCGECGVVELCGFKRKVGLVGA